MPGIKTILFICLFAPSILLAGPGPGRAPRPAGPGPGASPKPSDPVAGRGLSDPLGPQFALIPAPQHIEKTGGPGLLYNHLDYPGTLDNKQGILTLQTDTTLDLPSP